MRRLYIFFHILFLLSAGVVLSEDKPHPTLVKQAAANCKTCHDTLISKKFVHSALRETGCESCHEMKKKDKNTMVSLMEEGNNLCFTCHSEIEEQAGKKFPHEVVEQGCETCHNAHSADFKGLLISDIGQLCGECHETGEEEFKKKHGAQPVIRLGCTSCHNPHGSDKEKLMVGKFSHIPFQEGQCNACHKRARGAKIRLHGDGAKLCYACHSDKEKEFALACVHTPLKKGDCSDCHNPHMSNCKSILKKQDNQLCLSCHADIVALLKTENIHPPAEESCQECHSPHATKNIFQLKEGVVALCLNCHDTDEEGFIDNHFNQKSEDLFCVECHNPHGSKNKKLMNTFSHPPFAEKECDTCHENTKKDKKILLSSEEINDICLTCHDDKVDDESKKGLNPHRAIEADGCITCHSAHASYQEHLLKSHPSRLCATCHDEHEEKRKGGQFIHPIIDSKGCQACHDSHYSKNEKLLLAKPNRLCLACHHENKSKNQKVKPGEVITLFGKIKIKESQFRSYKKIILSTDLAHGHPQQAHIVSGVVDPKKLKNKRLRGLTFSGKMSCLSCHDPHSGASPKLFVDGIIGRFQLCEKCHKK